MRNMTRTRFGTAVSVLLWITVAAAQPRSSLDMRPRFVAELSQPDDDQANMFTLNVTFHQTPLESKQVEEVLRSLLKAAIVVDSGRDIEARAWFQSTPGATEAKSVVLHDGSVGLRYTADGQSIQLIEAPALPKASVGSGGGSDAESDVFTIILDNKSVIADCRGVSNATVAQLVTIAAENRGAKRRDVLKAMRAACKEGNLMVDRSVRVCMSAISKAAVAVETTSVAEFDASPAAMARGLKAYGVGFCAKCHQADGRGGGRGPDLTDSSWLHCDGSIAGIRGVLLTGVPQEKLKDPSRPFSMNPVTNLIPDEKQLSDLAVYVHSLSQN